VQRIAVVPTPGCADALQHPNLHGGIHLVRAPGRTVGSIANPARPWASYHRGHR